MAKLFVVAKVLLINENNEALVLRRSIWPAHPERSRTPDLPGGLVEKGESPSIAAARETLEETGIEVSSDELIMGYTKTFYDDSDNESHTKFLFVGKLKNTPAITLSYEHESHTWTPINTVLETYKFGSFYAEAIDYLIAHKLI